MSVEIREYAPGDEEGIGRLISSIQREEFGMGITLADQPDLSDIAGFYLCGAGGGWTAWARGRVVGTAALRDIGAGDGALRKMFVASPWRGGDKGVAGRLLGALVERARSRGLERVFLGTTAHFAAAHRFYAKNGFVEIEKGGLPATFPIMAVDTRFFLLDLREGA